MSSLLAPTLVSDAALVSGPERGPGARSTALTPFGEMSPELALVSPELAEAARRRLPDRPWEVALRRARSLESRSRPRCSPSARELDAPPAHSHKAVARRRPFLRRFVLAAVVVGVLAVGALRDEVRPIGEEELRTAEPPVRIAANATPVAKPSPLRPSSGYVVSPGGSFMTGPAGRTIEFFTLPLRCGSGSRQLVIQDIPVTGPSLRFVGKAVGRAATVRLRGRILDPEHVRGIVAAQGSSCKTDPVAFSARVS